MTSKFEHDTQAISRDLKQLIGGGVLFDEISRIIYSSGASIYRVKPLGIVQPRDKMDVIKVVKYAGRRQIPLIPRGGGTSRAGNEVGEGIVVDFSRYMNEVLEIEAKERTVWVQPGLILASLNRALKPHGLFFPIDPSTKDYCTIGGMIANNSSGPRAVRYGSTRDRIQSLEVVLSNGETATTGPLSLRGKDLKDLKAEQTLEGEIYRKIPEIMKRYGKPLADEKPFTVKNSSGYDLWRLKDNRILDLTQLLVGSEGTLGIVTEAKLGLEPLPGKTLGGLVYFNDLDRVGEATLRILEFSPTMVEILERRIIDLARKEKKELEAYFPPGVEALLFVEFEGDEEGLREKFRALEEVLLRSDKLAVDLKVARNDRDQATLEKVRSISGPILNKMKGPRKPVAFIEDGAVHPSRLSAYIEGLREIFNRHDLETAIYGHAGDGNLHVMGFLDLTREEDVLKMTSVAEACYDLVVGLGGTISGEHGDGRLRSVFLRKQYPALYPAMEEIKALFDPQNILNPGCIAGGEANPLTHDLKRFHPVDHLVLKGETFGKEWVRREIENCSGCGKCRSYCPMAQSLPEEWAMGRAKATLLREFFSGFAAAEILDAPEFKKVMNSCLNCKRCLTECPTGVDVPWLSLSGRVHWFEEHGESIRSRLISDTRFVCRTTSAFSPMINLIGSFSPMRRIMEKTTGVDRRRLLPRFQRRSFRDMIKGRGGVQGERKVVYFLSCYSNFGEPETDGLAIVDVLEQNGFSVLIPEFECCGVAKINTGAIRSVAENIRRNVDRMLGFVDQGLDIVFSEPSCALAVKMEYPKILKSEAAKRVADRCFDVHQFLIRLHQKGELNLTLGETKATVGYHNPCHLRAMGVVKEPVELLRLIPGVEVKEYSDGCCGLVGTFGLKRENFDLSMAMGQRLFEEIKKSDVEKIATSCGACKLQILQGARRESVHPVYLLAQAYRAANPDAQPLSPGFVEIK